MYEHHGDSHTLAHLRASVGFCAAHTRRLLQRLEAQWVMPLVYSEVVQAAREGLAPHAPGPTARPCPMCESRNRVEAAFVRALVAALRDARVAEAYGASDGLCFPHLLEALRERNDAATVTLVGTFRGRLDPAIDPQQLLDRLAGRDGDRAARHRERLRLQRLAAADPAGAASDVLQRLRGRLQADACPVCLASALAETRYLSWLATEFGTSASSLAGEGFWLCPGHLHDLVEEHANAGAGVALHQQRFVNADLARLNARLQALPAPTLAARVQSVGALLQSDGRHALSRWALVRRAAAGLVARRGRALAASLAPLTHPRRCGACHAWATAEDRELALLVAAVQDVPTARAYADSHGICLRHAHQLSADDRAGPLVAVLRARLAVLSWELGEVRRKSSWSERWNRGGPEADAWLRAPGYLDGRVFLGGPAPGRPVLS